MMTESTIKELRRIMIDNHRCFGCGHEHSCGTRGCAIMRNAADTLEAQQARIAELEAELKEERYRHDRVQDFEVAEAQELAKLREERRWIPVGERLPKIQLWCEDDDDGVHTRYYRSTPVAVYWDGDCCKAEYHESRDVIGGRETNAQVCWISGDHGELDGVTHWMPLPEEDD